MAYDYQRIFTEIDKMLSANPKLKLLDLAKHLQCSHPVIEKAIIKSTKLSFRDFKNNKILEQCTNLWEQGYSVKNIALEIGYKRKRPTIIR